MLEGIAHTLNLGAKSIILLNYAIINNIHQILSSTIFKFSIVETSVYLSFPTMRKDYIIWSFC